MERDEGCISECEHVSAGEYYTEVGTGQMEEVVGNISGAAGIEDWRRLQDVMKPLAKAATTTPATAIRLDFGAYTIPNVLMSSLS